MGLAPSTPLPPPCPSPHHLPCCSQAVSWTTRRQAGPVSGPLHLPSLLPRAPFSPFFVCHISIKPSDRKPSLTTSPKPWLHPLYPSVSFNQTPSQVLFPHFVCVIIVGLFVFSHSEVWEPLEGQTWICPSHPIP